MLDLQFNATTKFYSAPLQMKANNGVLIIDDFGRQRIRPEELLNRWIVPLDRGIDFLTLAGGKIFEVPFDLLVAFATNLEPTTLADEAFLRRIPSKVKVENVTPEQFHEIFRRVCEEHKLIYDAAVVEELMAFLGGLKQPLRPCYPRDLARQICWTARYAGKQPHLDLETVTQACHNYFLST
jgi:predicted ATPase with chaperone activity